jgi:hypothetical protein
MVDSLVCHTTKHCNFPWLVISRAPSKCDDFVQKNAAGRLSVWKPQLINDLPLSVIVAMFIYWMWYIRECGKKIIILPVKSCKISATVHHYWSCFFYRGPLPFWITKLNKLITIPSILITIDPFLTKFWLSFAKIKKETKWTTSPTNQSPDALKALIPLIAQALNGGGGAKISVIHQNMKSQINIALNVVDWLNYYGNIP